MTLDTLFADHQQFHSELQMDAFITVRSGGTPYGCYKQAVRELYKRWRGLKDLYAQRELLSIDLEELTARTVSLNRSLDSRELSERRQRIEVAKKLLDHQELDRTITDTEREFRHFYGQAIALKKEIGDLTPERKRQLDREMWIHNLRKQAAIDAMCDGRPSRGTIELMLSMPEPDRTTLLSAVAKPAALLDWLGEQSPPAIDPTLPAIDVRKLVNPE